MIHERHSIQPEGIAFPTKPYSPVVVSGDLVFISGQIPIDAEGTLVDERFELLNRQYAERFREPRPVRTTIVCQLLDDRFLVEMDVIARARACP